MQCKVLLHLRNTYTTDELTGIVHRGVSSCSRVGGSSGVPRGGVVTSLFEEGQLFQIMIVYMIERLV